MLSLGATLVWAVLLLGLLGLVWGLWRTPPEVTISREQPAQGFEGRQMESRVRVKLTARWPTRVVLDAPAPLSVVPDAQLFGGGLVWGEETLEQGVQLSLNRRGVYTWPDATLRWADPFGLFWRSRVISAGTRLVVYPGTHGLTLPALLRPLLSDGALSRTLGLDDPISLRGVRPYSPGDPPGRIHWRMTARSGDLMVRELERTASSSVQVHLDLQGSEVYVESAVRLAASLVQEALELDLPVSVSDAQGATPGGRTPEALRRGLERLAQMQAVQVQAVQVQAVQPGTDPSAIPTPRPGSNLLILTQRAGDALLHAALLARAGASRVVVVALPEGFYLEPGESPRRQWAGLPDTLKELERKAGVLEEAGVGVVVLRGDMSVLSLQRR